ncbi:MAG: ATP-binding protein, partial [Phascolarctobacterium sp.]
MQQNLTARIENIFNPRSFPEKTYVSRTVNGKEALEDRLARALAMKGNLVFVSGASKSGKTVLCHRVIPQDRMINLSGVQIASKEDFWQHIAEQLPVAESVTITNASNTENGTGFTGKFGASAIVEASGEIKKQQVTGSMSQVSVVNNRTERQIVKYLLENDKVLVIDDFHYASESAQYYVARVLKTELFNGLKTVVVS